MNQAVYLAPFVRSFFEDHLVCRHNASQHTIQGYRDGLKLLLRFVADQAKKSAVNLLVTDITEPVVLAFLADLEQTRGNSIQTRNHRLVGIRQLFEYIAAREPLFLDHCHRIAAIPKKRGAALPEIHYLEKEHVTAILGAVNQNGPLGRRDYHHVAMLSEIQKAADSGALFTYHFNMLRSILEKTATFFGHDEFSACLKGMPDEGLYARALNLLSHGQYAIYEPREMLEDNKDLFRKILAAFLGKYQFDLPTLVREVAAPPSNPA